MMMVHILNAFLFWCLCAAQLSDIFQPVPSQTVKLGDSATIKCHIKSESKKRVWYKVTAGKRLQLVVSFHSRYNRSVYADGFQHQYSVKFDSVSSNLTISATSWGVVGTYFCGVLYLNDIQFGSGTSLMLKGANVISNSVVQQPESKSVQPGDSVTLSCSVHTGHCAAEHTHVTWLKNSDHSALQMIYSSSGTNHSCRSTGSGGTICVYNVLLKNLSSDDAGTFSCVVTSCGQILFGNGTRINIHNIAVTEPAALSPAVIALMLSNIILGIVTLIVIRTLCKIQRKDSAEATDGSSEDDQTSDAVVYAAVCLPPRSPPARQATVKCSGDPVVYSSVRFCQRNQDLSSQD